MEMAGGGGGSRRLYTYRYTVTTRMTSAFLRWAAMKAILTFRNCEVQSHKKRKESRSRFEPRSFCLPA